MYLRFPLLDGVGQFVASGFGLVTQRGASEQVRRDEKHEKH